MASPNTGSPKLILEPNVPQEIALKYPSGREVASHYGDEKQVMFSLVDGRVAFVSLGVAQSITNLQLGTREPFFICKYWNGAKTQRPRYNVWLTPEGEKLRAEMEEEPPFSAPQDPPEDPSEMEQQLAASIAQAQEKRRLAAQASALAARKPPVPAQAAPAAPGQGTGTNGPVAVPQRAAAPAPAPAQQQRQSVLVKSTYAQAMTEFLLAAGRATREAEQVLGAEGGSVRFDSRDVAALATSMFIACDRSGALQRGPGAGA